MEEDTGKSLHVGGATGRIHGADYSLVDYNRAGIPLIEIVTKPIARHRREGARRSPGPTSRSCATCSLGLGVSDVRMEQGSLRCDVNLSLRAEGLRRARHPHRDQERQLAALGRAGGPLRDAAPGRGPRPPGGTILQETRHWHEDTGITTTGREKSDAEDYRYFPEPDLVPVAPSREWVEELRGDAARAAAEQPGPAPGGVGLLRPGDARHRRRRCARRWSRRPSRPAPRRRPPASGGSASWPAAPTRPSTDLADAAASRPAEVARVQALVDDGTLNDKLARQVFDGVLAGEGTPDEVVAARGLGDRLRRRRARRRGRQRHRRQPRRRRQDPRRQGRRGRRAHRRGDEGDARPGRRRPGPRADPREAVLTEVIWPEKAMPSVP